MEQLISSFPTLLEYSGSLAQLALVIVFVWVFKKGSGNGTKLQESIDVISDNHLHHMESDMRGMNAKMDSLITNSAVQTEILREIRDNLRK